MVEYRAERDEQLIEMKYIDETLMEQFSKEDKSA